MTDEITYVEVEGGVLVGIEGEPGQICVLNDDGTGYCYWPTQEEIDEMDKPRDLTPAE